jgi:integrase
MSPSWSSCSAASRLRAVRWLKSVLPRDASASSVSVEQVEAIVRGYTAAQDRALIVVAAYTGLRMGELRALRWADVDFATGTVHVRRNLPAGGVEREPKSGKVRSVPMLDPATAAFDGLAQREHYTAPADRVFVSPTGGPVDDGVARRAFYDAMDAAGLTELRDPDRVGGPLVFHSLRHCFGTWMVQVFPIVDVQAWMGHADVHTTMRYAHHVPKHDAAARFAAAMASQREPSMAAPRDAQPD